MMHFFNFFDKAISEIDEFLEDRFASKLGTKPAKAIVRSRSQSTSCIEQPQDIIQILDISASMDCSDYPPTRLNGGIEAATEHVNSRAIQGPQDRIAIVTFNIKARIVLPLTPVDQKERIVANLSKLNAGGGTDIAEGLHAAIRIFEEEPVSERLRQIILLTDGDGGNPIRNAAKLKKRYGVVNNVVGIGSFLHRY